MSDKRTLDSWSEEGEVSPGLLQEWAYDENAIFMEQDEDLLLHDTDLLPTIIDLITDLDCPKRKYLYLIIADFTLSNFRHKRLIELQRTAQYIEQFREKIANDDYLSGWAHYFNDTTALLSHSKNIDQATANKYGWALLKGLTGTARISPAQKIEDRTWEVIYLAPSVRPYIHIDSISGDYQYMGYK